MLPWESLPRAVVHQHMRWRALGCGCVRFGASTRSRCIDSWWGLHHVCLPPSGAVAQRTAVGVVCVQQQPWAADIDTLTLNEVETDAVMLEA